MKRKSGQPTLQSINLALRNHEIRESPIMETENHPIHESTNQVGIREQQQQSTREF
jgi:hypothetical protein